MKLLQWTIISFPKHSSMRHCNISNSLDEFVRKINWEVFKIIKKITFTVRLLIFILWRWETGNNIIAQEEGFLKSLGPDPDAPEEQLNAQVQQGSYTYTSPEGQIITITYTADETGFHAEGDHLPTPPPVSPEVQKGLDLIYAGIKAQQVNRLLKRHLITIKKQYMSYFVRKSYFCYHVTIIFINL